MTTTLTNPRIVIPAAGAQSRWGNGGDNTLAVANKLLVSVHGEPLLKRTGRQLKERAQTDVIVICDPNDPTELPGTGLGHSVTAWANDGKRTTVLFGDVCWSDAGLDLILACDAAAVTFFGRSGPGRYLRRHREIFGLSFPASQQAVLLNALRHFAGIRPAGMTCGGWPIYAILQGRPWNDYSVSKNFVEIDDETSDFDRPEDWIYWRRLFEKKTI